MDTLDTAVRQEGSSLIPPPGDGAAPQDLNPKATPRSKICFRIYFTILTVLTVASLLLSLVILVSFAQKQSQITAYYGGKPAGAHKSCILYAKSGSHVGDLVLLRFPSYSPCAFILWGLVSVTIVIFSFLIYLVVLVILGTKICSPLRILELIVFLPTFILSFILSLTITAGLKQTCSAIQESTKVKVPCFASHLEYYGFNDDENVSFYESLVVAQNTSWAVTLLLFIFCVWTFILVMSYCLRRKKKKRGAVII